MSPSHKRSLLGIAFFIPVAAVLLLTFACLPAPVGDPDQSKVDAKLTGAWQAKDEKANETIIVLLRPWDAHTYYLQYIVSKKEDGKESPSVMHFKAWLSTLGTGTFLTAEPLDNLDYAFGAKEDKKPYWIVGRIELKNDALAFRLVKPDSWIVKDLTTREKLEAAIKAQADNDELYGESLAFKKMTREEAKIVEDALETIHVKIESYTQIK